MVQIKKNFHADGVPGHQGETLTKEMWDKISPKSQAFLKDNGFLETVADLDVDQSLAKSGEAEIVDGKDLNAPVVSKPDHSKK